MTAVAFAAWCATVLAAISCAGQLAWSGTIPWSVAFPAMATVHMFIGVGEGLISALVFLAVYRARPDLITETAQTGQPQRLGELVRYGLLVTLGVAVFVAPFACSWPDGLDSVAEKLGFEPQTGAPLLPAPAPDYQMPGIHWAVGATALAGAVGSLIVFGLASALGRWLVPKPKEFSERASGLAIITAMRDSPVHRLPAALKLGVALVIIVVTVLAPLQWTGWFVGVAVLLVLRRG